MDQQTTRIKRYKVRNFGSKLDDTFGFVRENFKPLLKFLTYFMLPVSLVQGLALNGYFESVFDLMNSNRFTDSMNSGDAFQMIFAWTGMALTAIVGPMLLAAVVYALMQLYEQRPDGLLNLTGSELRAPLLRNLKRCGWLVLFGTGITIVVGVLLVAFALLHRLFLLIAFAGLFGFVAPLMLLMPIYLFENIRLWEAFVKALRLGFATWGGTMALAIVLGLIVSIVQGVISIPMYIAFFAKTYLFADGESILPATSALLSFGLYLMAVVQAYLSFMLYSVIFVGLGYQYGHASEKLEFTTMNSKINRFENL